MEHPKLTTPDVGKVSSPLSSNKCVLLLIKNALLCSRIALLFSKMTLLFSRTALFFFQNCPFIFHYDPFLFQNYFLLPGIVVLFSRGVILILKNTLLFFKIALYFSRSAFFLLTVLPYFQECFFTSWLYLLVLLRAVQRDSICLVLVLFPFKIDLLVMTCILLEFIFKQKTSFNPPVDIIMSYFIDFESVNSIWYKFKQGLHVFEKTVVLEISREKKTDCYITVETWLFVIFQNISRTKVWFFYVLFKF